MYCSSFTPLFSTKAFPHHFTEGVQNHVDEQGLYRPLLCQLFPGTKVECEEIEGNIVYVTSETYRGFTDKRMLQEVYVQPEDPRPLEKLVGLPYVWGGNDPDGMEKFCSLYGHDPLYFKGLDCSGLFYYMRRGNVPRDTSQLVSFGEEVEDVKPLDIVVWEGHMLVVLGKDKVIESREGRGVIVSSMQERLCECPSFFLRRIPEALFERC